MRAACYEVPVTPNTPSGIAGCERWGDGIASHYGPGSGVAMNFCTFERRTTQGCGEVAITSLQTGITVTAPVVDFCDCWTGSADERIVDLQYGVLAALGLDPSRGLYRVRVTPAGDGLSAPSSSSATPMTLLPDTAMEAS